MNEWWKLLPDSVAVVGILIVIRWAFQYQRGMLHEHREAIIQLTADHGSIVDKFSNELKESRSDFSSTLTTILQIHGHELTMVRDLFAIELKGLLCGCSAIQKNIYDKVGEMILDNSKTVSEVINTLHNVESAIKELKEKVK